MTGFICVHMDTCVLQIPSCLAVIFLFLFFIVIKYTQHKILTILIIFKCTFQWQYIHIVVQPSTLHNSFVIPSWNSLNNNSLFPFPPFSILYCIYVNPCLFLDRSDYRFWFQINIDLWKNLFQNLKLKEMLQK